jgi:hypothetical protein
MFKLKDSHRPQFSKVWGNLLILSILVIIPFSFKGMVREAVYSPNRANSVYSQAPQFDNSIYLPIVLKYAPLPPPIFGVETNRTNNPDFLDIANAANIYWIRGPVFSWEEIEPTRETPPNYHWESINGPALIDASSRGFKIIATIKFTPEWAQKYEGVSCGPIAQNQLSAFAEFLHELVSVYGAEPFNVKYWEVGNEPDVDHRIPNLPPDSHYGCWGEGDDDYYGGGYYADMLKVAYPAIKSADPQAKVLVGGLLVDCDPTNPPTGKDCKPAKFFEGILQNGGGNYFDIVSYHGYPFFQKYQVLGKEPQYLYYDEHHPYWESRGGVVLGKADFLKEVMAFYRIYKPIINSEAALTCPDNDSLCNPISETFFQSQADYVIWLFVRNWAAGFWGTIWFTLEGPGWRNVGLLNADNSPRPAYNALEFLSQELENVIYKGPVTIYPTLRGYEFGNDQKRIWVLWAHDEQPFSISIPTGVLGIYDKFGDTITPQGNMITVKSPVYMELNP